MTTRTRAAAIAASVVLALPVLAACGPTSDDCDTNSSAQTFAKPGGGSGGGGKGGGSKGGKGGSKSKPKPVHVNTDHDDDCDEDN